MPLISVVIPAYNAAAHIQATLESALAQTCDDFELIISDDGSTDNTVEAAGALCARFPERRVRILRNPHLGPGGARNSGIEVAEGQWIAFLDSDDLWFRDKLEAVAKKIGEGTADLICHSEIWMDSFGKRLLYHYKSFDSAVAPFLSLYRRNALSTSAVAVRKELLLKAGLFDTALPAAQDYDLWLRLSLIPGIRIEYIEEVLGVYVTRQGNISSDVERWLGCMRRIGRRYRKALEGQASFPALEALRFEGRAYTGAGLRLIKRKERARGLLLLSLGMMKCPRPMMAFNLIKKALAQRA
ncbi:MAG TPA: glycosyltransferase [Thermodesulfobacteriota bacterium]